MAKRTRAGGCPCPLLDVALQTLLLKAHMSWQACAASCLQHQLSVTLLCWCSTQGTTSCPGRNSRARAPQEGQARARGRQGLLACSMCPRCFYDHCIIMSWAPCELHDAQAAACICLLSVMHGSSAHDMCAHSSHTNYSMAERVCCCRSPAPCGRS